MANKTSKTLPTKKRFAPHKGLSGFVFWNLLVLVFIKAIFSYSGLQFASLLDGVKIFDKEEVIAQTNIFRQNIGLNTLAENSALDIAATQKLSDMTQKQYFAHNSPSGVSPWYWIDVNQYKYTYAGENLAIGFFSAKDTVDAWINSPTHRDNLANPHYREIGIAIAPAKIQNTEGFLVVQLFGTPIPTVATRPTTIKPSPAPNKTIPTLSPTPLAQLRPATTQSIPLPSNPAVKAAEEITQPIVSNISQTTPQLAKIGQTLNFSFILYAIVAFLVSLILLVFKELNKELVVRTAASFAILMLAIAVPMLQASHTVLIL